MIDSAHLYNHLPLAAEVRVDENALSRVLQVTDKVFQSHSLAKYTAITMVHRHFKLDDGTIVAWTVNNGELRLQPSQYDRQKHQPVAWAFGVDGHIVPIEYASETLLPEYLLSLVQSIPFSQLKTDVFDRFRSLPSGAKFGLTITPMLFSEFFFSGNFGMAATHTYYESPDQSGLFTRVAPLPNVSSQGWAKSSPEDAVSTIWAPRGGKMRVVGNCHCKK